MSVIDRIKRGWAIFQTKPEIRHYQDIEGFLSPYEAILLYRLAMLLPPDSTIVEIGSWKGKSTYCLARGLRAGKVIAIDPFDASGDDASKKIYQSKKGDQPLISQFKSQMERLGVMHKIEVFQGYSHQFVGQIDKIDFLFIDGDHSQESCDFDFTNYAPAIPHGGYLAFHDFDPSRKDLGPTWVIENRIIPSKQYEFVGLFDSLWVGKKL